MTDRPQLSPEQLARMAALRQQRPTEVPLTQAATPRSTRRTKPAQLSKIVTAGLSTSLVLGLVTVMGWSATTGASDSGSTPQPAVGPIVLAPSQPLADPTVLMTAPVTVPASVGAAPAVEPTAVPVAAAPVTVPVTAAPAPVVIDIAVPAPQPVAQPAPSGGSNGQTKQSK
ncbi:MAG: hypothetical protein WCP59_18075 [Actinomycetota bacterium]